MEDPTCTSTIVETICCNVQTITITVYRKTSGTLVPQLSTHIISSVPQTISNVEQMTPSAEPVTSCVEQATPGVGTIKLIPSSAVTPSEAAGIPTPIPEITAQTSKSTHTQSLAIGKNHSLGFLTAPAPSPSLVFGGSSNMIPTTSGPALPKTQASLPHSEATSTAPGYSLVPSNATASVTAYTGGSKKAVEKVGGAVGVVAAGVVFALLA